jgi:secreted PhoX family phosphatase
LSTSSSQRGRTDDTRRAFLRGSASLVGTLGVAGSFEALWMRAAGGAPRSPSAGYGELTHVTDENTGLDLLKLPQGFRYVSFGWTGDPMSDETPMPSKHDGMAVIAAKSGEVVLCRNHEVDFTGKPIGGPAITYDLQGPAGCVNLRFDTKAGKLINAWPSLSGTSRNCAGGPTPWGSWLTCEETMNGPGTKHGEKTLEFTQEHGWVFEVPAEKAASPVPLRDMGRFTHEAVAVDPKTGIVYETEDSRRAGFYRFVPKTKGQLAKGGRLQMMKVAGLSGSEPRGQVFGVTWVDIEDPQRPHSPGTEDFHGVYHQGKRQGATTFGRLEGCCFADGAIYFVSTSGGAVGKGQVWEYQPRGDTLRLVFESPSAEVLNRPDNITVSPRGGIVLCEDAGVVPERLLGLTRDGIVFPFAENNILLMHHKNGFRGNFRNSEWCGATFSPDGEWLFANIQTPGVTFAITGPWKEGAL